MECVKSNAPRTLGETILFLENVLNLNAQNAKGRNSTLINGPAGPIWFLCYANIHLDVAALGSTDLTGPNRYVCWDFAPPDLVALVHVALESMRKSSHGNIVG